MDTVSALNATCYDLWLPVLWLTLLLKLLPKVLQMAFSSDKKKTRQKKKKKKKLPSYLSLALPQSTSFGQYHSNMEFYLSKQIPHASLKETASDQTQ